MVRVYASRDIKRELIRGYLEGKRLAEIAKPEAPLDAVSFLRQLPVWGPVRGRAQLARACSPTPTR
jgi:hypothetical protein